MLIESIRMKNDQIFHFNISQAIERLSKKKKESLANHLINSLLCFMDIFFDDNEDSKFISFTSIKEYIIHRIASFIKDEIDTDFTKGQNSQLIQEKKITYNLETLIELFDQKKPSLFDEEISQRLNTAAEDSQYVLGLEIDMDETKNLNQLVFAIFEKEGEKEISRTLISETQLGL